jgi:uncharacterized protein with PQ loop repeat
MSFGEFAGWAGAVLVIARIAPQAALVRRTGRVDGLSAAGTLCWFANDLGWLIYGVTHGLTPLWLSSLVLLGLDTVLLAGLGTRLRTHRALPGVVWLAAVVVAAALGQAALAVVLLAGAAAGTIPHAVDAWRATDLSGVSPLTWRLGLADGALWGIYGLVLADTPVVLYAVLTAAASAAILVRMQTLAYSRQEDAPRLTAPATENQHVPDPAATRSAGRLTVSPTSAL